MAVKVKQNAGEGDFRFDHNKKTNVIAPDYQ